MMRAHLFLKPLRSRFLPLRELLLLCSSRAGQEDLEFLGPDHAFEVAFS